MITRIYWAIWAVFFLAAFVLFLTGKLTMTAIVVCGFISFGLVFMGMMSVLPATIAHSSASSSSSGETNAPPIKGTVQKVPVPGRDFQHSRFPVVKSA